MDEETILLRNTSLFHRLAFPTLLISMIACLITILLFVLWIYFIYYACDSGQTCIYKVSIALLIPLGLFVLVAGCCMVPTYIKRG